MDQNLVFNQQLSQQQKLSHQMIQAVSLLSISTNELSEIIYNEVEKNPVLEITKDSSLENTGIRLKVSNLDVKNNTSDSDAYQSFLESSPSRTETLQEHLLQQLNISKLTDEEKSIAEKIIFSLDERGYFVIPLEELFSDENTKNSVNKISLSKKVLEVLEKIQKFDPIGVICKNLQESLELQAKAKILAENKFENEEFIEVDSKTKTLILEILHSHFELLEKPRANYVQKKLQESGISCSIENVEKAINFIRELDPFPARQFSIEKPIFINPDICVRRLSEDELLMNENENNRETEQLPFSIELIKTNLPTVKISKDFLDFQDDNSQIKKAITDAKFFLNAIQQRNSTLLKVAIEIVKYQLEFFEKGPLYLKPLRLKDIAEKIDVHETTVSRISNGKYLQCEWGLFEIKYFFSNAVSVGEKSKDRILEKDKSSLSKNNKERSKESIKHELLAILETEDGKSLSDQKISEKLAEKGINIARRTVAKYRKELNFDSSYDR